MVRSDGLRLFSGFLGSACFLAAAAQRLLARQVDEVADGHLSLAHLKLLRLVAWGEGETVSEAALFLGVSNAAASKSVERLVQRGLLQRSAEPQDRRVSLLSLTAAGRRLMRDVDDASDRALQGLFGDFTTEEMEAAQDLLDRVSAAALEGDALPGRPCFDCGLFPRDRCSLGSRLGRRCFFFASRRRSEEVGPAGRKPMVDGEGWEKAPGGHGPPNAAGGIS